jgi:hypothetical protein
VEDLVAIFQNRTNHGKLAAEHAETAETLIGKPIHNSRDPCVDEPLHSEIQEQSYFTARQVQIGKDLCDMNGFALLNRLLSWPQGQARSLRLFENVGWICTTS